MKYKYKDADDIIRKIEIKADKLVIYFIDNKKTVIFNYTEKDLEQVKQKMLEQAIERDKQEFKEDFDYNYEKGDIVLNAIALGSIGGFDAFIANYLYGRASINPGDKALANFVSLGLLNIFIILLSVYFEKCLSLKKDKDVLKYHLYLNNKELFDAREALDINDLDRIDYKNLRMILQRMKDNKRVSRLLVNKYLK